MEVKKLALTYEDKRFTDTLTFKDLYEEMQNEIKDYETLGLLDELMEQKVIIHVNDNEGNLVTAEPHLFVGWLEGGSVCMSSRVTDVYIEDNMSKQEKGDTSV